MDSLFKLNESIILPDIFAVSGGDGIFMLDLVLLISLKAILLLCKGKQFLKLLYQELGLL